MNRNCFLLLLTVTLATVQACGPSERAEPHKGHLASLIDTTGTLELPIEPITRTEEEWRELLSSSEYRILRNRGTELPFINKYWDHKEEGIYYCRACGLPLFRSDTKFRSGTGWPSFWGPYHEQVVEEREDNSFFMTRTEIVCARCGSHIGHLFEDGPEPTGLRYCMNSAALQFRAEDLSGR